MTEIIQTLVKNGYIGEVFRSHLEKAFTTLLAQKLTAFLTMKNMTAVALPLGTQEMVCTSARCTPNMTT